MTVTLARMSAKPLSARELKIWHAFKHLEEDVLSRVGRDLAEASDLSGPEFGVLSRLVDLGEGELRQQKLAASLRWDKSRLCHQLTRMPERA